MKQRTLKCMVAQENFHVGNFEGNGDKIIDAMLEASQRYQAQLVVFSELAISAYPPEDLLLRPSLELRVSEQIDRICQASRGLALYVVFGFPEREGGQLFNSAGVVYEGELIQTYRKQCLPNYQVFDEKRYFSAGDSAALFELGGWKIALSVCEDIWFKEPAQQAKDAGADLLININASPFHVEKMTERQRVLSERANEFNLPIIYAHCVGGQDELVFDGGSMVYGSDGDCLFQAPRFEAGHYSFCLENNGEAIGLIANQEHKVNELPLMEELRQALVLAIRDYVQKNGFQGVVLGLSGGIDSALTLALAAEALGADKVEAVMMPFRYTSQMSQEDAAEQAETLGVRYQSIAIEGMYREFMASLAPSFEGLDPDTTEENLQARTRGVLLMAISNKKRVLVLTTGNKSEMAVGYSTLYGDMAGGYDVLKDLSKTRVFALARYLNEQAGYEVIPNRVIERPPSAELAPDQKDEDSLPDYDTLDQVLELYVEKDQSAEAIIAKGFDREMVYKVLRLVDLNEYKRQQAPLGPRLTQKAFGKDRRYPITHRWSIGK